MAERDDRLLADCLAAAGARRARAEAAHAAAVRGEVEAAAVVDRAGIALTQAADEWARQVAGRFDPTLGALLGRELLARAAAKEAAQDVRLRAAAARERSADDWRAEDMRGRALEDEVAAARRRRERRTEERGLAALADRETFVRSRR